MTIEELAHQADQVCILGFGREGQAVLRAMRRVTETASPTIADQMTGLAVEGCRIIGGSDYLETVARGEFTWIVKAPGIPPSPLIEQWRASGKLTSATQIFFDTAVARGAFTIAITGSKGKSTTTSLIAELLGAGGKDVRLVGNIGNPAVDDLPHITHGTICVHETSSYQLNDAQVRPDIAVVTAFFPEHLDYHGSLQAYWEAKARICRFQTSKDTVIFQRDFHECAAIAEFCPGERIGVHAEDAPVTLGEVHLKGRHNLSNIALAVAVADHLGVPRELQMPILRTFKGLPHRLQSLGIIDGVEWVDDAISTTPDSAIAALDALGKQVTTIILGGKDRGVPFERLGERIAASSVTTAILFPGSGPRIRDALSGAGARCACRDATGMEEAVRLARELTPQCTPPAICLLSTASPSYGMFKDFEEKGQRFAEEIQRQWKKEREEVRNC